MQTHHFSLSRLLPAVAAAALSLFVSQANAASLTAAEILSQFNAVISNEFSSGHDVEGRLVAKTITGGATFYNKPQNVPSAFAAINAIDIKAFGANINNGGSVNYQNSNLASFNYNGGGSASQSPAFAISDFTTPLDALALRLSNLTTNSYVNAADANNFTFVLTPDSSDTAVFSLTTAELSASRNLLFSGSANTIIINVTGTTFAGETNFNADAFINTHVIWNFVDATSLNFKYWHGAVLAGNASVTNSSPIEGMLYAKNFNGNGELHDFSFAGTLPPPVTAVPEPETYAMILMGMAVIGFAARRKQA